VAIVEGRATATSAAAAAAVTPPPTANDANLLV